MILYLCILIYVVHLCERIVDNWTLAKRSAMQFLLPYFVCIYAVSHINNIYKIYKVYFIYTL